MCGRMQFSCYLVLFCLLGSLFLPVTHAGSAYEVRQEGNVEIIIYLTAGAGPWLKHNVARIHNLVEELVSKIVKILDIKGDVSINITIYSIEYFREPGKRRYVPYFPEITENGVAVIYVPYKLRYHIFGMNVTEDYENLNYLFLRISDAVNVYFIRNYISPSFNDVAANFREGLNLYLTMKTLPVEAIELEMSGYPNEPVLYLFDHNADIPLKEAFSRLTAGGLAYRAEIESFAYWLINNYGLSKYLKLYKLMCRSPSIKYFKEVYGLGLDKLEEEWLNYLRSNYRYPSDYEPFYKYLALTNTTIVYDSSYPQLREAAQLIKNVMLFNYAYLYPLNNSIVIEPSAEAGDLANLLLRSNVLVITLSNTSLFRSAVKLMEGNYVGYCSNGFRLLNKCYTNSSDMLTLITNTNQAKALGIITGNNATTIIKYIKKHPIFTLDDYASGYLYINNSVYIIYPLTLQKIKAARPNQVHYLMYVAIIILTLLTIALTYLVMRCKVWNQ